MGTAALTHLQSTFSLWYLHSASELPQNGDTGSTVASLSPSKIDPDDAAPNSSGRKHVPEAVGLVASAGATLHDYKRLSASLRLCAFGPRDLTSDGIYRSNSMVLLNAEVRYRIAEHGTFSFKL